MNYILFLTRYLYNVIKTIYGYTYKILEESNVHPSAFLYPTFNYQAEVDLLDDDDLQNKSYERSIPTFRGESIAMGTGN